MPGRYLCLRVLQEAVRWRATGEAPALPTLREHARTVARELPWGEPLVEEAPTPTASTWFR